MHPNLFTLGMLLTCHLLMARIDHTAVMSFMKGILVECLWASHSYTCAVQQQSL